MSSDPIIIIPVLLKAVFRLRQPHYTAGAHLIKTLGRNVWPTKVIELRHAIRPLIHTTNHKIG
jgi:hypothetical protein